MSGTTAATASSTVFNAADGQTSKAKLNDLESLRQAYETLRAEVVALRALVHGAIRLT